MRPKVDRDRRVVVTGLGLVTPLGTGVEKNWDALLAGRSGIGVIDRFDTTDYPTKIAGQVRDFDPLDWIEKKDVRKMDLFIQYAMGAAEQAMRQSGLKITEDNADDVGVLVGVGIGGLCTIEENHLIFMESRLKRITPFFIPKLISNLAPGQISIRYGARGANFSTTSACASGSHAIGEAYRMIRAGYLDAAITGGAEAAITSLGVGGFVAMRALSTRNDIPAAASRPFDRERDGFVMAEGAASLILEERESAIARGANILAEIVGYATNADAYHITSPSPEGQGAAKCMQRCLEDGGLDPNEVDYINAHGTSTPQGDIAETQAIKKVFGEHAARLAVSSTKSMTGHTLGAAGAIEAAYTVLAILHSTLPPTINHEFPDPECDLDYVPNRARPAKIRLALKNSFGFGGTNTTVAFRPAVVA
ncbi:MAG TPA: beta-ketoacyl-ACP synthase II [Candidatus Binataceae bacterium]|jgi:3-oxoacyl-[acyl-carrier-protein] synthase II|nr:beta-ketoacyl-ACP synthase II [Candidatus Binataceae bacterium]